ncbi:sensor histidine kinase [Frisingicoccus sp.]|uniref:sensor histidine kinase n=1 Tax=Frisingicoccus sp. TaxID=1918627 RepID=UPI002A832F42|nr:HAMP domain-containing sensor histidine kinase [Frisingicoccus sp.]
MDGKGGQKVIIQKKLKWHCNCEGTEQSRQKIRYVLWTFAALAMLSLLFVCGMNYAENIRQKQLKELLVIYPELQLELQDNFSYYQGQITRFEWMIAVAVIILMFLFGVILLQLKRQEQKRTLAAYNDEMDLIYEQLIRFQKGDFESVLSAEDTVVADRWKGVHEKLREMGYYFSDLKERLAEEENSTKTLITDISHQLKTPLASVRMCHELAQSPDLSEEERSGFLETETQEIAKMESLLDELVKLSRLENNMIQITPERNSLIQTIREAVGQTYMKAYAKNIEICADMEEDVEIFHDRKWTVEALANILENAVKYSTSMTKIYIRMSRLPNNVLIEMEDEGIGIPEEELHEIFHRFYRGSNAKEMAKEGAGVGLYLARSIIEQQGGTILAKRKPGCGTIFKIMLPI